MVFRVVYWDRLLLAGWALLAVLNLLTNNVRYHIPLNVVAITITLGIISGIVLFGLVALRTLKIIEKKGVYSSSFHNLLFLIGIMIIIIGLLYWVFLILPLQSGIFILDFLYPMLPAALLTRTLLYWRWEQKNKRLIYATSFSGKVYAYPYILNT